MPEGGIHFMLDDHRTPDEEAARMLTQTVQGNYERYTPREVKLARMAREAKAMMANPSQVTLKDRRVLRAQSIIYPSTGLMPLTFAGCLVQP